MGDRKDGVVSTRNPIYANNESLRLADPDTRLHFSKFISDTSRPAFCCGLKQMGLPKAVNRTGRVASGRSTRTFY